MKRTYFPRQILLRLEEAICSELNLKESPQHRLKTEDLETYKKEEYKTKIL